MFKHGYQVTGFENDGQFTRAVDWLAEKGLSFRFDVSAKGRELTVNNMNADQVREFRQSNQGLEVGRYFGAAMTLWF